LVAIRTASGWHHVVGKIHTVDHTDAYDTLAILDRSGFGPRSEYSVPRPLVYFPSLRLLLEEKSPGTPAKDVFLTGTLAARLEAAARSAQWLVRFHETAPRRGPITDGATLLGRAEHWAKRIAPLSTDFARKSRQLYHYLAAQGPPAAARLEAGHGSFMPEHVLLDESRTTVIDFDEGDVADPARDLAWFIVSLERLGLKATGSPRAQADGVNRFVQVYRAARPGAVQSVDFYRVLEYLHRARRDLVKRIPPRPDWADLMLEEGLRVIEGRS
jgi:hypothetical protein